MLLDSHFEDLDFSAGRVINTSMMIGEGYTGLTHWHPFTEILLSLREGNEVELNFRKYEMHPNDFIISYPGDLHSVNNVAPDSFFIIQFPMELITVVNDLNRIKPFLSKAAFCSYDINDAKTGRMIQLLKEIVNSKPSDIMFEEAYNYSLLLQFFSLYGEKCLNEMKDEAEGDEDTYYRSSRLMAEACLYISQNCRSEMTLNDIAKRIGVSKSYFSHLFKSYTNMTFVDYLTRERIRVAESMFADPSKKLIDIAFECGFLSISSFNRSFKKIKGIAPRDFRKAMRSQP
ncbi:MAG: AraC family transcriptional regulator [Lachnospiraceae bacterium]|nr:AraC family transcriptional regulator [Lachnospiraceae bacterium]